MTTKYEHTPECIAATAAREAFLARWPAACRRCGGRWYVEFQQGHPYGSTIAYEMLAEPCPDCAERGVCGRCGVPIDDEEEGAWCSACGAPLDWRFSDELGERLGYFAPVVECRCRPCAVCGKPIDWAELCGAEDEEHRAASVAGAFADERKIYTRGD